MRGPCKLIMFCEMDHSSVKLEFWCMCNEHRYNMYVHWYFFSIHKIQTTNHGMIKNYLTKIFLLIV